MDKTEKETDDCVNSKEFQKNTKRIIISKIIGSEKSDFYIFCFIQVYHRISLIKILNFRVTERDYIYFLRLKINGPSGESKHISLLKDINI